jgi:hypothetical protein
MSLKMNVSNGIPMSVDVGNGWGQHVLLDLEVGDGCVKIDNISPVCYMDNVDYEYLEEGWMREGVIRNKVEYMDNTITSMIDESVVLSALSKVVYVGMSIANWVTGG